jgi:hypothetical protein
LERFRAAWRSLAVFSSISTACQSKREGCWSGFGVKQFGGIFQHFSDSAEEARWVLERFGVVWSSLAVFSSISTACQSKREGCWSGLVWCGAVWRYFQAFRRLVGASARGIGPVWWGVEQFGGIFEHFSDSAEEARVCLGVEVGEPHHHR